MHPSSDVCAVLLVGGLGTRLRPVVSSLPKPLASIGNRPFLELLVEQLRTQSIRRLVMCTGHLAEEIEQRFGDGSAWGVDIQYSRESSPMGTGGATKLAGRYLQDANTILVMNGDSFLEIDFARFIRFHREKAALLSMAVCRVDNAGRYGTVHMDPTGRVTGFAEKTGVDAPGLVNAGVYVCGREALNYIPDSANSLERDVFPRLIAHGLYAQQQSGLFIDIGTPQDYARADALSARLRAAAANR